VSWQQPRLSHQKRSRLVSARAAWAFQEALGEEGRKVMQKIFADTVNGVENQLFALNPKLSFAGPSVVASDPAFWTPKPPKEGGK